MKIYLIRYVTKDEELGTIEAFVSLGGAAGRIDRIVKNKEFHPAHGKPSVDVEDIPLTKSGLCKAIELGAELVWK